jgi:hypothetical protein
MKSKQIGIITHFHKSANYGGVLQSLALCKFLNDEGFLSEQILFDSSINSTSNKKTIKHKIASGLQKIILNKRYRRFDIFRNNIPNSIKVFDYMNISETNNRYDTFITGSDQVWNFKWFNEEYFLSFVDKKKEKISYAASLGSDYLDDSNIEYLKEQIADYKAISLREPGMIPKLEEVLNRKVSLTVDPTLLISNEYWNELASPRLINKKYLFCYFLGADINVKKTAIEYAKKQNLTVVNIPFSNNRLNIYDILLSNNKIYSADPSDFLSLIKHADMVFTDSFHAVIFSNIFKKNFIAFSRMSDSSMDNRMRNIVDLFDCKSHFVEKVDNTNYNHISKIIPVDYSSESMKLKILKQKSLEFIMDNLSE